MIDFTRQLVFLAPLARITILPFRILCRETGADATVTEMISAKSLIVNKSKKLFFLGKDPREKPVGIQLVGRDPVDFKDASKIINDDDHYDWVDINFGCPSPDITGANMGAQLLTDLERAEKILATTVKHSDLPVSVKIRLGPQPGQDVSFSMADIARENRIAFMTIHSRFTSSTYQQPANWNRLKEIKDYSDIPVIGSGDVKKPRDIERMFEQTGVDGVMIGRAARTNPLIFARKVPSTEERVNLWKRFLELCNETGVYFKRARQFAPYFFRDFPRAAVLRHELSRATEPEEVALLLREVLSLSSQ
ncbi:MAG: tRNA dihydrouridine synthase [Candidatus Hodarchaeales archaeon]|jgi:tRNA-dihydrouridine synthase B